MCLTNTISEKDKGRATWRALWSVAPRMDHMTMTVTIMDEVLTPSVAVRV